MPAGHRVLVLGLGDTGWAAVRWLLQNGYRVRVADTRVQPPYRRVLEETYPDVEFSGGPWQDSLFQMIDWVVVSPGVALDDPLIHEWRARGMSFLGDVEVAARVLARHPQRPKILAVTGANGKSTVVTLLGDLARAQNLRTVVAGNIGIPLLEVLMTSPWPEVLVLELSSFQLETLSSLAPDSAVVLNVSEDHMDRYSDIATYAATKARIYQGCESPVGNRQDLWVQAMISAGTPTFGLDAPVNAGDWGVALKDGERWLVQGNHWVMRRSEVPLRGEHNVANVLAALAMGQALGWTEPAMLSAIKEFRGLPHRMEWVADVRGVRFFDDSKGTNVGATVAALKGLDAPVVLIAGGDGKGQDFSPLRSAVATHAQAVVLIGRDGARIDEVLEGLAVPRIFATDLQDAVQRAFALARPGESVLMSPACASFDMFRNYLHRAEVYCAAVHALARSGEGKRP
ncbi:MAG: UDP-N-acetylmuramoyl-L-alanine--D-glutamate ligase [Ferrovum sp.]|nr:UDP-N-acetylmuramoyl-L-alanine--D-glutamate ligase [Ferrovum sp.]NDU89321.1 UDP-N-acetylmuramoyl-L-alanine--D-glutamate ligase [Ferrovum sp.]